MHQRLPSIKLHKYVFRAGKIFNFLSILLGIKFIHICLKLKELKRNPDFEQTEIFRAKVLVKTIFTQTCVNVLLTNDAVYSQS